MILYPKKGMAKPRMTQADSWKKRPIPGGWCLCRIIGGPSD